jgi:hypothetical protein
MMYHYDPILAEVHERKARVSAMLAGITDWPKHIAEERAQLEREGWHYVDPVAYFERIKGSRSIVQKLEDEVAAFIAQEDAQRAAMA